MMTGVYMIIELPIVERKILMSVVIIGGNEAMKKKIGCPDLMVLFTSTVSHKMVRTALSKTKGTDTVIVRSHSSSMAALRNIMEQHA